MVLESTPNIFMSNQSKYFSLFRNNIFVLSKNILISEVEVMLSLCLIKTTSWKCMEEFIYRSKFYILTSAVDESEWPSLGPGRFNAWQRPIMSK
jgi:hypothetical protein